MLEVNGVKKNRDDYVTKNFKYREFASKDGSRILKLDIDSVKKLQELRDGLGVPIIINSAYRSPNHNKAVGGAKGSRHLKGDAFDIRVAGYTPLQIANYARYLGFTGISAYNTFTHIDTRPTGFVSWGKNKNKIKPVPLPKKPKKPAQAKPLEFRFESDVLTFDVGGEIFETYGIRRYLANDKNFLQYIALRDLEVLGYDVEWKKTHIEIKKGKEYRKVNLNLKYNLENISHALVRVKMNGKMLELEGHVIYDKHKNATQFIAVKDLKGLGFTVEWDSNRRLVVLK